MTTSVTQTRILDGFVHGGAIDKNTIEWPDLHAIFATCRTKITKEEVEIFENNFTRLYEAYLQHGKIPEELLFDEIGFRKDSAADGSIRERRYEADCHQREMCLSQKAVRMAQETKLREAREERQYDIEVANNKISTYLAENKYLENKLPQDRSTITYDLLGERTFLKAELKAYIYCRLFQTGTVYILFLFACQNLCFPVSPF